MQKQLVKLSALTQFSAGKVSLIISGTTAATVLSMKFSIPWLLSMVGVAFFCVCAVIFVYISGWARKEYTYNAELSDVIQRLDRIEKSLSDLGGVNKGDDKRKSQSSS